MPERLSYKHKKHLTKKQKEGVSKMAHPLSQYKNIKSRPITAYSIAQPSMQVGWQSRMLRSVAYEHLGGFCQEGNEYY